MTMPYCSTMLTSRPITVLHTVVSFGAVNQLWTLVLKRTVCSIRIHEYGYPFTATGSAVGPYCIVCIYFIEIDRLVKSRAQLNNTLHQLSKTKKSNNIPKYSTPTFDQYTMTFVRQCRYFPLTCSNFNKKPGNRRICEYILLIDGVC